MLPRLICAALVLAPNQAIAQSCLNQQEAEALVTFALPTAVRAVTSKCTPVLPATTALVQSGPVIAARYQVDADKAWPMARLAFDKMAGLEVAKALGDSVARGLIDGAIGTGLVEKLKPSDCAKVDRIVDILQPLPTRNMALLITTLMELGQAEKQKKSPFKMCPVPANGD